MKKTIAMLLAIVVASIAICTLTVCAFADETTAAATTTAAAETTVAAETTTAVDLGRPTTTAAATTAAATTAATTENATGATQSGDAEPTDSSTTSVDDGTTKAPAAVDDDIPATGSGIVVPAVALLALAGGVAVAVKSKKN